MRRRNRPVPQIIRGRVERTRNGIAWLLIRGRRDVIFNKRDAALLGNNDYVEASVSNTRNTKAAFLKKVLERGRDRFPARLNMRLLPATLTPLAPLMPEQLPCDLRNSPLQDGLRNGLLVMAQRKEPKAPGPESFLVTHSLGDAHDPAVAVPLALACHEIRQQWSAEVTQQRQQLAEQEAAVLSMPERRDHTDTAFCTIDGPTARDFDDAVWCEPLPNGGGWHLQVAIADVSAYVLPDTPLDTEARKRGTSVYFRNKVVPMLPKELSENLCSLVEGKDRPAVICAMHIGPNGNIADYDFFRATIRSAGRLTYAQALAVLENQPNLADTARNLRTELGHLRDVSAALDKERHRRGALDIDLPDESVELNPSGKPQALISQSATEANRLIENAMLAANTCAAEQLYNQGSTSPLRHCPPPTAKSWQELLDLMQAQGLNCQGLKPDHKSYQYLLRNIQNKPDRVFLTSKVTRSMQQAEYTASATEHFPLALERYTHFTSPIRRYPDLLVHRQLLTANIPAPDGYACASLSQLHRQAESAGRQEDYHLRCLLTLPLVGKWCPAHLTGIMPNRIQVRIEETSVTAILPRTNLKPWQIQSYGMQTECEWQGRQLHVGDRLEVMIAEVVPEQRHVWFSELRQQLL